MSITTKQINDLRRNAAEAGDLDMVAIASLALDPDALIGAEPGTAFAELAERGMTQASAIAE